MWEFDMRVGVMVKRNLKWICNERKDKDKDLKIGLSVKKTGHERILYMEIGYLQTFLLEQISFFLCVQFRTQFGSRLWFGWKENTGDWCRLPLPGFGSRQLHESVSLSWNKVVAVLHQQVSLHEVQHNTGFHPPSREGEKYKNLWSCFW